MFSDLFTFDIRTMVGILFLGNLTSALLIFSYQAIHKSGYDREFVRLLYSSRFIRSVYYLLIFLRGAIPDLLSVNLGNTLMFISLYMDGYLMLKLSGISTKMPYCLLKGILAGSVILFNFSDFFFQNPDLRVSLASLFMFAILLMPSFFLTFSKNNSGFMKIVGLLYIVFLMIILPRSIYSLAIESIHIFTNNLIQSLTFISLTLIMVFSAPAFLLIMKENADIMIEKMAVTDGLTKIQNRQSFMGFAQEYFEQNKRLGQELTICFFDIDFFKRVNDTYGHSFGDEVLIKFAEIIKHNMRSNDLSCRYGGEEFLALLPSGGEEAGILISERMMREISGLRFESHPEFRFTISTGIRAGIPSSGDTLSAFINRADAALYEAKNTGRNKIIVYHDR